MRSRGWVLKLPVLSEAGARGARGSRASITESPLYGRERLKADSSRLTPKGLRIQLPTAKKSKNLRLILWIAGCTQTCGYGMTS